MKKSLDVALGFGVLVAATFLYYYQQNGDTDIQGYSDWIKSLLRGALLKIKATAENATGNSSYMDIAASLVSDFETFSAKVYNDAGHMALGYGHDIIPGDGYDATSTISESEAWDLLEQDLLVADDCISRSVSVDLTDNQRAALISLVYNIGCGNFSSSTLLRLLNQGDYEGASEQFSVWNKAKLGGVLQISEALVSRRASEQGQFNS